MLIYLWKQILTAKKQRDTNKSHALDLRKTPNVDVDIEANTFH